ncbi:MAG: hypothetical protein Q8N39_08300 [Pelolinea sp.]|nr:hypothetical protein [Pelolinea sp.]
MNSKLAHIEILGNESDLKEWDDFVSTSPQGTIFAKSWWLRCVCDENFIIVLFRDDGEIICGLPMQFNKKKILKFSIMPKYTQTLGPIFKPFENFGEYRKRSIEIAALSEILSYISNLQYIKTNCHYTFSNILPFHWNGYNSNVRYTYVIDDLSNLNNIFINITPKYRNKILKAENLGVRIIESDDIDLFLNTIGKSLPKDIFSKSFSIIKKINNVCELHNSRKIYLAIDPKGFVHSGLFIIYDSKCAYNLIQGGDKELRKSGANILAMWHSIKEMSKNSKIYDFEGSMLENIEIVFRSFGAIQKPFYSVTRNTVENYFFDILKIYAKIFFIK